VLSPAIRNSACAALVCGALASLSFEGTAFAQSAEANTTAPAKSGKGFAVVAAGASADDTWPAAQAVYKSAALRPKSLDEPRARVLAGEAPPEGASAELRDLAELRAGVKGDDAASRQLLSAIADKLGVEGLVVLFGEKDALEARVFLRDGSAFDAAHYKKEADGWSPLVASLERTRAAAPEAVRAPLETRSLTMAPLPRRPDQDKQEKQDKPRPFYLSPWFWGAIGAAAFAGGAVYLATRDTSSGTIKLQMRVPQ
jgi:hypothetical protein